MLKICWDRPYLDDLHIIVDHVPSLAHLLSASPLQWQPRVMQLWTYAKFRNCAELSSVALNLNLTYDLAQGASDTNSDFLLTHSKLFYFCQSPFRDYLQSHQSSTFHRLRGSFFVLQNHSFSWKMYLTRTPTTWFSFLFHFWKQILTFVSMTALLVKWVP